MFRHVALLTLAVGPDDERIDDAVAALRGLPAVVPGIRHYEVARDAGLDEANADIVIVAEFDDAEAYGAYRDHPRHRELIAEHIRPILGSRAAVQHER